MKATEQKERTLITFGHSPDPDDAFMFYALAHDLIDTGSLRFENALADIETLNGWAFESRLPVTAVSVHAYGHITDRYEIMPYGASVGRRYGPIVVARRPYAPADLDGLRVAVPGKFTTAALAASILLPAFRSVFVPFTEVFAAIDDGTVDAGILIHEGQLTYREAGFHLVADLGELWHRETGLPLPLGVDVVRSDLESTTRAAIIRHFGRSIRYSLEHRAPALEYAARFGRGLDPEKADRFVGMYVNEDTLHMNAEVKKAIMLLVRRGVESGRIPENANPIFAPED